MSKVAKKGITLVKEIAFERNYASEWLWCRIVKLWNRLPSCHHNSIHSVFGLHLYLCLEWEDVFRLDMICCPSWGPIQLLILRSWGCQNSIMLKLSLCCRNISDIKSIRHNWCVTAIMSSEGGCWNGTRIASANVHRCLSAAQGNCKIFEAQGSWFSRKTWSQKDSEERLLWQKEPSSPDEPRDQLLTWS